MTDKKQKQTREQRRIKKELEKQFLDEVRQQAIKATTEVPKDYQEWGQSGQKPF